MDQIQALLEKHDLRITQPRLKVAEVLFGDGVDRHVTAEWTGQQVAKAGEPVALATIYNTLNTFVEAGLLKVVRFESGGSAYFDTNLETHHHFVNDETGELTDISIDDALMKALPQPPEGQEISSFELFVHTRPVNS